LTGSHHDAEDLAQTALVRAFVKWHRVRDSDDPAAYVRQTMVHCHADRFRRRRVAEWLTARLPDAAAPVSRMPGDESVALLEALRRLPIRQRTAVVLHYFEDMSVPQTATHRNIKTLVLRLARQNRRVGAARWRVGGGAAGSRLSCDRRRTATIEARRPRGQPGRRRNVSTRELTIPPAVNCRHYDLDMPPDQHGRGSRQGQSQVRNAALVPQRALHPTS
jgi:RNA polymerase sigma-70 factor (sigma-E family)